MVNKYAVDLLRLSTQSGLNILSVRTAKINIADAREWVTNFVNRYNKVHKHSGIKYVTPEERHNGLDNELLANRRRTYLQAQQANPSRWRNNIRNWDYINEVSLNPESKCVA